MTVNQSNSWLAKFKIPLILRVSFSENKYPYIWLIVFLLFFAVALSKPAKLSSMWDSYHHPGNAVNNVLVCPYGRGYLAHTRMQVDPWLEINLQSSFEIRYIVMYARQDCCGKTLLHQWFICSLTAVIWQKYCQYLHYYIDLSNIKES